MWKDFFYFTKTQRNGIIVMIIIIIILIVVDYFLPFFIKPQSLKNTGFIEQVKEFEKSLVSRDSLRKLNWQLAFERRQQEYDEKYKNSYQQYPVKDINEKRLTFFDPNTIDSSGFVKLGIKPHIASNILKYRNKGGKFRTATDFSKVYGITKSQFEELLPYINIKETFTQNRDTVAVVKAEKKQNIIVELNSADTLMLMQVSGIGRGYAKSIVNFRKAAGGFVSVEQLKEIYGMREQNYERIKSSCVVDKNFVIKIKVNTASVDRLNIHPYLDFYQAKAIYELRRKRGKLKAIADLNEIQELDATVIEKIKPYLSFE